MKVKDLYPVISPYLDMQVVDSKLDGPITPVSYLADSGCEINNYADYDIYALIPKIDNDGNAYLAILIEHEA
jgi:hypothetical protein